LFHQEMFHGAGQGDSNLLAVGNDERFAHVSIPRLSRQGAVPILPDRFVAKSFY
jgi:hypothetical protein